MAKGRFLIDIPQLEEMGADIGRLAHPGLRDAIRESLRGKGGEALATEMKLRAPVRTGGLVSQIAVKDSGGGNVGVGYQGDDGLGTWIESGAKPHTIKAKRKGDSLFFHGSMIKSVEHPGFRGRWVAKKSLNAAEWEVLADIVDVIRKNQS